MNNFTGSSINCVGEVKFKVLQKNKVIYEGKGKNNNGIQLAKFICDALCNVGDEDLSMLMPLKICCINYLVDATDNSSSAKQKSLLVALNRPGVTRQITENDLIGYAATFHFLIPYSAIMLNPDESANVITHYVLINGEPWPGSSTSLLQTIKDNKNYCALYELTDDDRSALNDIGQNHDFSLIIDWALKMTVSNN